MIQLWFHVASGVIRSLAVGRELAVTNVLLLERSNLRQTRENDNVLKIRMVWQKTTEICKAIVLQWKNKKTQDGRDMRINNLCQSVSLVALSCPTLCDLMECSTLGLTVHHQLLEFAQTHIHGVDDAIQPSHPLSSPSLPTFSLSQHQVFFKWVSSSHQVAKVLELQLQHQVLPMNIQDQFPLGWTGWISLQSKGLSRVFSNTTVQKHQFFGAQLSL